MKTMKLILRALLGLFIDDQFLALAVTAVVGVAAVMSFALKAPPLIAGATLLFGCVAVLVDSVWRAKRQ